MDVLGMMADGNELVDEQISAVDRMLESLVLEPSGAGAQKNSVTTTTSLSTTISTIFPTEVQKLILRNLDWQSLIHLRATNRFYRETISKNCQEIWKAHHDAKWQNGKRMNTRLSESTKDIKGWSLADNWALHPKEIEDGNWFGEFLRRCRLDQSVPSRLLRMGVDRPQSTDLWYSLMKDGLDIVDCLKRIVVRARSTDLLPSTLQVTGERVLTGISRCVAYQEWAFLHEVNDTNVEIQLEDGAIALAKFYSNANQIVVCQNIHQFEMDCIKELTRLAGIIKDRLDARSVGPSEDELYPSSYLILEVVEEMKYLFNNSDLRAFRGNVDNYYDHTNSLINYCLHTRTGIPITLAVIYSAIVRRVCGVPMDIIGLPGHIVVGIPYYGDDQSSRVFVDPFNDGRILSLADCRDIVGRYNMSFSMDMVNPLSNTQVWQRMVRNLIHCHSMQALAEDNNDDDDGDDAESSQEWKIAIPLRFFLSDYASRVRNFRELVESPGWCVQFCS